MAHSNSHRFTVVLVGTVTTDTASFGHIGCLLFEGYGSWEVNYWPEMREARLLQTATISETFLWLGDCQYLCCQHTALPRCELTSLLLEAPLLNT